MSVVDDLIIVCADAPDTDQRRQADALLSRELLARLNATNRTYDFGGFPIAPSSDQLGGGIARARGFWINRGNAPANPSVLGQGTTPRIPDPAGSYGAELAAVTAEGTALVSAVKTSVGLSVFNAARRAINGWCNPGEFFVLYPITEVLAAPGNGELSKGTGTWHIQISMDVWTLDPANPGAINIDLDGVPVTRSRASANIDDLVHVEQTITVVHSGTQNIRIGNGGSYPLRANGVIRVY